MAASTEEETEMRRKKWFTIKMVALGFAVAAVAAPVAQAIPEGVQGSDLRVLRGDGTERVVGPDDRIIHGTNPQVVKSPDDRVIHGARPVQSAPQQVSGNESRFELSNDALSGIVLGLLAAAAMGGYAVHQVRKAGKLASV
jgi:hypothetical protein